MKTIGKRILLFIASAAFAVLTVPANAQSPALPPGIYVSTSSAAVRAGESMVFLATLKLANTPPQYESPYGLLNFKADGENIAGCTGLGVIFSETCHTRFYKAGNKVITVEFVGSTFEPSYKNTLDGGQTVIAGDQSIVLGLLGPARTHLPIQGRYSSLPDPVVYGVPPLTISASASSGLPVSISWNTPSVCGGETEVSRGLRIVGVGTCSFTVTQAGLDDVRPALPVTRTFPVLSPPLALSYGSPATRFGDFHVLIADVPSSATNPAPSGTVSFKVIGFDGTDLPGCQSVPVVNSKASCVVPSRYVRNANEYYEVRYSNSTVASYLSRSVLLDAVRLTTSLDNAGSATAGTRLTVTALMRHGAGIVAGIITFTPERLPGASAQPPIPGCEAVLLKPLLSSRPVESTPDPSDFHDSLYEAIASCSFTAPASGATNVVATYRYPAGHPLAGTTESATQTITNIASSPANYTDMWWGGARENGWGVSISQHGATQFNVIYAYDNAGKPTWYVMPGCAWNAGNTVCTGGLYQPTGAPFAAYDVTRFAANAPVGSATFTYKSANTATMSYTINGTSGSKEIERLVFGATTTLPNLGVNDIWWNGPAENGWGLNIAQQGRALFPVWYTYGADGKPTFFAVPGGSWEGLVFTGPMYTTTSSPWLGMAYDATKFVATQVGTMVIDFRDASTATVTYTVGNVTQTKVIKRQEF